MNYNEEIRQHLSTATQSLYKGESDYSLSTIFISKNIWIVLLKLAMGSTLFFGH